MAKKSPPREADEVERKRVEKRPAKKKRAAVSKDKTGSRWHRDNVLARPDME